MSNKVLVERAIGSVLGQSIGIAIIALAFHWTPIEIAQSMFYTVTSIGIFAFTLRK